MLEPFSILPVAPTAQGEVEQMGSKPKFWFRHGGADWLFKEARENTGEDWAEKIASEVAHLLELPAHHAELADWMGRRGCAVRSFLSPTQTLVHGNELLGAFIAGYDREKQRGQSDHTIENIVTVIEALFPPGHRRQTAAARMIGYLMLDALVGNTDRHHENWAVLVELKKAQGEPSVFLQLAPTFDHASSLGRELTDDARRLHLGSGTITRYIRRGRGGIFENRDSKHGLSPIAVAQILAQRYPDIYRSWRGRLGDLTEQMFSDLLQRIPCERMSSAAREFALTLILTSRQQLLEFP